MGEVLVVAATERELCGLDGLVCGIGPVEAAASTARRLELAPPTAVLHVGVAGAASIPVGGLVVGTLSRYADLAAAIPVVSTVSPDARLVAAVRSVLPGLAGAEISTSAAVGGAHAAEVEAMEGFGVLRACALAGVPAVEVRAISNRLGEGDRSRWDVAGALDALAAVLPTLVRSVGRSVEPA